MDLLTYSVNFLKSNDIIKNNSLEEEIESLEITVKKLKDEQHDLKVKYSDLMKCTADELQLKYDEYANNILKETKNKYINYINEQTKLTNLLSQINSVFVPNSYIFSIKNNIISDIKNSAESLLISKEIVDFNKWKNDIIEEYKYQIHRYESDIVTYEVKLDRFKKLLVLLTEGNDN